VLRTSLLRQEDGAVALLLARLEERHQFGKELRDESEIKLDQGYYWSMLPLGWSNATACLRCSVNNKSIAGRRRVHE
jgi:hypothetical protein